MEQQGDFDNRFVYEIADYDTKEIYIGLTVSPERREYHHMRNNKKLAHLFERGVRLNVISELLPTADATSLERNLIREYTRKGYIVLNEKSGGSVGQVRETYTFKRTKDAANRCSCSKEFQARYPSEFNASHKKGWYREITSHFVPLTCWSTRRNDLFAPIR